MSARPAFAGTGYFFKVDGRPGLHTPQQMLALREGWAQAMRGWFKAPMPGCRQVWWAGQISPTVQCIEVEPQAANDSRSVEFYVSGELDPMPLAQASARFASDGDTRAWIERYAQAGESRRVNAVRILCCVSAQCADEMRARRAEVEARHQRARSMPPSFMMPSPRSPHGF